MNSGAVPILKPPGITSHSVVSLFRRMTGIRKAGHTGTLDPAAVGVVVVCFGAATRLVEYTSAYPKRYRAELTFGWSTDTQDSTGNIRSATQEFRFGLADIDAVLEEFVGEIKQVPPMVSAVKKDGVRLYRLAMRGDSVEREPRTVKIHSLQRFCPPLMLNDSRGSGAITYGSCVILDVECSPGTYVRTLCEDIGARLGVEAHMSYLVRLATSGFTLEDAVTLEELQGLFSSGREQAARPPFPQEYLVRDLPRIRCLPNEDRLIVNGLVPHRLAGPLIEPYIETAIDGRVAIYTSSGRLAAVARAARQGGSAQIELDKVIAADE